MDEKTFISAYVAQESVRIKDRLKKMVTSDTPPSEEEREQVMHDIGETLSRMQRALSLITLNDDDDELLEDKHEEMTMN